MIYFVQGANTGAIKIGFTDKLPTRLSSLRNSNQGELKFLCWVEGDKSAEAEFHQRFCQHRLWGEWFSPHETILEFVTSLPEEQRVAPEKPEKGRRAPLTEEQKRWTIELPHILRTAYGENGARALAHDVGSNVQSAHNWLEGKIFPSGVYLCRLIAKCDLVHAWVLLICGGYTKEGAEAVLDEQAAGIAHKKATERRERIVREART